MRSFTRWIMVLWLCGGPLAVWGQPAADSQSIKASLKLLARKQVSRGAGLPYGTLTEELSWNPRETALVVCDMWDQHGCQAAAQRVAEMAPRLNEVLKAARSRGVLIVHCPSQTMDFYKGTPQRLKAMQAPAAEPKVPLKGWCSLDSTREPPLPIDDSDGGCDGPPVPPGTRPWTRQIATLDIHAEDAITDSDEAYRLFQQHGIKNVIVTGVHTNMCVLGRPFSIRQMVYQGFNVALMRDLTDAMYNPEKAPFVSHFTGTDLVVQHIERHWCPTILSTSFVNGTEFRFAADTRPHLVMVVAEDEYKTETTLPPFGLNELGKDYRVSYVFAEANNPNMLMGLEAIAEADVLLISARRRPLPPAQLEVIRRYVQSGKPMVGIRTASHPFSLRNKLPPAGLADWSTFDADVWGGNYTNHHGNTLKTSAWPVPDRMTHPILKGIPMGHFETGGSLYRTAPLAAGTVPLILGRADTIEHHEPVAWTYQRADGGKSFYTSLGHEKDFDQPVFRTLLKNGIDWAAAKHPGVAPNAKTSQVAEPGEPSGSIVPAVVPGRRIPAQAASNVVMPLMLPQNQKLPQSQKFPSRKPSAMVVASNVPPAKSSSGVTSAVEPANGVGPQVPTAAEVRASMKLPDDLSVELVLSEPEITQPVFLNFDHRGRLWVMEYRQYPDPAGLKLLSKDKFWRAVYDKVPLPPPHGDRGADRISIHEDRDGDGRFESHKVFLDGLNIATSFAHDAQGVWVLNPPYLLYVPDKNQDDIPDGDPEVHLSGFGLEDTHSVANSLRWGPDGWLYAAQGSTVSGRVMRPQDKVPIISQGQHIWRYHPPTKRYEIFAEGGGNAFGVEFDSSGRLFSGHNGGNTRGFHYTQGAYLQKGFSKHGAHSNPYAFGYFGAMRHHDAPRFSHHFVIYQGSGLPGLYSGRMFALQPMLSQIVLSEMLREGTTFRTLDVGYAIEAENRWFRPVDIKDGPDGHLYVADWCDQQLSHTANAEGGMDRDHGRIWRIAYKGKLPRTRTRLTNATDEELLQSVEHTNRWHRQTAQRLLRERKLSDRHIQRLRTSLMVVSGGTALEWLWTLDGQGQLDSDLATKLLRHPDSGIRQWTVRLLGDRENLATELGEQLASLARRESTGDVRAQLAATSRRLPAAVSAPILSELFSSNGDIDANDSRLPLNYWWGLETLCSREPALAMQLFANPALWERPLVVRDLLPRLMRRFAASGLRDDLAHCITLLSLSPNEATTKALMEGFETAYRGRSLAQVPPELAAALAKSGGGSFVLKVRQQDPAALAEVLDRLKNPDTSISEKTDLVELAGEIRLPGIVPHLLELIAKSPDDRLRAAAIGSLGIYADEAIPKGLLRIHAHLSLELRQLCSSLLASRPEWSRLLLNAVANDEVVRSDVPIEQVRLMGLHKDPEIRKQIAELWPGPAGLPGPELQQELARLTTVLEAQTGNPYAGKVLFQEQCGRCHKLHGTGGEIGPDLTPFRRQELMGLLASVVNPSAEIREGFETTIAVLRDGRIISGFLLEQDPTVITLKASTGQRHSMSRTEIDELQTSRVSLMPERLLTPLTDQQVSDLFAYLRSSQPLAN